MRCGLTILPEIPWAEQEPRWRAAEEMGFDHAWTYDHLVWGGLPDSPWFGTTPTLTAAAMVTSSIGLGTFVSSPNFRHPLPLWRDVQALDDISDGRFLLGVGTGGDRDSAILGGPTLSVRDRVARFQEFTDLLVELRAGDHVTSTGRFFSTDDARTLPPVRSVPLVVAGNGPRSVRYAARVGDGWATTGPSVDTLDAWFAGLASSSAILDDAGFDKPRYLLLDAAPVFSLSSVAVFEELAGRAGELGFTDVITHWPRPSAPYAGDEATLEAVAAEVLPRLR